MENLETRKYSVKEISSLLDLCTSEHTLTIFMLQTEDLHILELSSRIYVYRAAQSKTIPKLSNQLLEKLLRNITPDNCDNICSILITLLHVDPSYKNFKYFLEHLRDNDKDMYVTVKLLELSLSACEIDLFHEILGTTFLIKSYLKINSEGPKSVRQFFNVNVLAKHAKLARCNEITEAVLRNGDMQTLLCLNNIYKLTQPEFWKLLQTNLLSDVYGDKKLALHVLKGCIKHIASENELDSYSDVVHNGTKSTINFTKIWNDFFNLIEALDENQLHLITPSLALLDSVVCIHPMWLPCVYKSVLTHSLNSVVFHGLTHLLSYGGYNLESRCLKAVVKYVLVAFNKVDNSEGYHKSLLALADFIGSCNNDVFVVLVQESLGIPWVPISAWYFYKTILSSAQSVPDAVFADLIRKLKGLPHKFIRDGCLSLAVHFLKLGASFECNLRSAAYMIEYDRIFGDVFQRSRAHFLKTDIYNELEKWRTGDVFVSASKVCAIVDLMKGDDALLRKLFSLSKNGGVPPRIRDHIVWRLSKVYLSETDVIDYLCQRIDEVNADVDLDVLIDIVNNNLTTSEDTVCLREKAVRILSKPKSVEQLHLAAAVACCINSHGNIAQILEVLVSRETMVKMQPHLCDFFIHKYCTLRPVNNDVAFRVFEDLLSTQEEDVVANVFKNLPGIIGYLGSSEKASKFLELCYGKLPYLKSSFMEGLRRYLTCRLDLSEVNHLLEEYEASAYVLADFLENKFKEATEPELFVPVLVKLLLYGVVYGKQRRIEYDVCLEIERLSVKRETKNPALEETKIRSKMITTLLNNLGMCRRKIADAIVSVLLEKYRRHFNKRYFADSQIHLQKLRTIQALLLVHSSISTEQVASLKEFVTNSLSNESHQPSVKHLLQWLMIRLLSQHQDDNYFDELANKIKYTDHARPLTITAFIPILLHACKDKSEETIEKLFDIILPWTMGPQFKLRTYSQIAIEKLADFCLMKSYNVTLQNYKTVIDGVQVILRESSEKEVHNIMQTDRYFLDTFDPERHFTLETIYTEIPRLDGVAPTEWELLNPEGNHLVETWNRDENLRKYAPEKRWQQTSDGDEGDRVVCNNIQKKIIPWMHVTETGGPKSDLILVCSLIESPANLGGLSRTCEIYGVKQMVVRDAKTKHSKDFKGLSMSSENWVEIVEVKVEHLKDYFMSAKKQGYVIVGAEQTFESVRLNEFRFPLKSLLVLGNEREGVSPSIIPLLDVCLEIPQFGFVRSLNVHVAGAIFIWEYAKQHLVK